MLPVCRPTGLMASVEATALRWGRCAMLRFVIGVLGALAFALPAAAQVEPFPASFRTQEIETNGVTIHVRVGGKGPAVVLLHGYGETSDAWAALPAPRPPDHTALVPGLRGAGLS